MKRDCEILKEASIYVREWIEKQPSVKEESLTDWLLYNISEKAKRIIYRSFTRNEEAKTTGADWEWWFLYGKFSYKFRVQAKKINVSGDNYPSIGYANRHGLQIEKLIEDSNRNNFLPIYAFYTDKVDKVRCGKNILDEGVYISGANGLNEKIIKQSRKVIVYNDILEDSIPLSCMLCCPISDRSSDEGFSKFISTYFGTEMSSLGKELGRYSEIPRYIISLLETAQNSLPDWWEKEFSRYVENVNGILVFDYRDVDTTITE